MFQELTGFVERLDSEEHDNWVIDKENDGSPEHPIQMPHVNYGREAVAFEDAVYKFVDEHFLSSDEQSYKRFSAFV